MRNKVEDLRNHLFAQLEKLMDEDLKPEELEFELKRSVAVVELSATIIESAKVEVQMHSVIMKAGNRGDSVVRTEFFQPKQLN